MFPFVMPWDDASAGVTNISAWLDKPAGASGFVTARDGHLFAGDKRIRFLGVNLAFGGNFPTHADAEKVAARMAKFGINCVRFHHMDTEPEPVGLLQKDRRNLNPESLDRLDYFIAQLKKHGIYSNLNLHVGNKYPGMPTWEGASGYFKGLDLFFPPMIEQQRDYARALLTHVNPYTGKAYVDESAVALIEINNENGLVMEWNNSAFDGMPDPYAAELSKQWNAWLGKKYGDHEKLAGTWSQGVEPKGDEMLKPSREAWNLELHGGAQATREFIASDVGEVMHIRVTQPGQEAWHVQTDQSGLKLVAGKTYTIRLRAKADNTRKIAVVLSQHHEPWKVLAMRDAMLSKEWQEVEFSVPVAEGDDNARLSFSNLGSTPGEVWINGVSLRPGGIGALREGEKLGTIAAFQKKHIGSRTLVAQQDWNEFMVDTETAYWTGMQRFIRDKLQARSLILGTASGFSPWMVQAKLDVVDAHAYWQHPVFPRRQWDMNDWTVENVSMAGAPDGGTLPGLALRRVANKPFIVTEYNAASPNSFSSEAFLELGAMAALQDWDGIFVFAYSHRLNDWDTKHFGSFFDIDQQPTKMATLPAVAALFMRADVQPTGAAAVAETTMAKAMESIRLNSSWADARAYGVPLNEIFRRTIAMRLGDAEQWAAMPAGDPAVIRSQNGQLTWDTTARRMLVASPRSAGVIGNIKAGEKIELGQVAIVAGETQQNWSTINLTVIDGSDFKSARRLLVVATGMSENTGMRWKDEKKTSVGTSWGGAPSRVEGINARIQLPALKHAKAWALDERGQRKGEVPLESVDGQTLLPLASQHQTLWWEIEVPDHRQAK